MQPKTTESNRNRQPFSWSSKELCNVYSDSIMLHHQSVHQHINDTDDLETCQSFTGFQTRDSLEPGNYNPISILPVVSKTLEKATHKQHMNYLETENLLCNQQYGFRRKRSTKMAATLFCDRIRQQMNTGKPVGAIYQII